VCWHCEQIAVNCGCICTYKSNFIFAVLFQSEMGKFMKTGKVVLVLGGRFAGRKAVIVKVLFLLFVIYLFIC